MALASKRPSLIGSIAVTGALIFAVLAAAALFIILTFLSGDDRSNLINRSYRETERLFQAAIDPRFQTKAEEVDRVANRLVVIDVVKGGALFDDSGHLLETFGEATETSFQSIGHSSQNIFAVQEPRRLEYYYAPAVTGTPYHLIARVDITSILQEIDAAKSRTNLAAGMAAASLGLIMGLFLFVSISMPTARILRAIEKAVADPATADSGVPLRGNRTEMGSIAAAVEHFRSLLGTMWRNKVMVADSLLEKSPFGIIQLSADGSPIFSNPAASHLFDRDMMRGTSTTPILLRDVDTDQRAVLRDHLRKYEGKSRLVEVIGISRFAMATSITIGVNTKTPTTIAMLADVSGLEAERADLERLYGAESRQLGVMKRREHELKLMLESCITLLGGADKGASANIDLQPLTTDWIEQAQQFGIIANLQQIGDNPQAAGAPDDLRAVCRLALLVACSRSGRVPVNLLVDAKGINFETVGLTVRATPAVEIDDGSDLYTTAADWQLAFAALRTALRRVNGQLAEFNATDDFTVIKLVLKGAAERVQTTIKGRGAG